jgi:sRNA-binding regulator protein Hfq
VAATRTVLAATLARLKADRRHHTHVSAYLTIKTRTTAAVTSTQHFTVLIE